VTAPLALMVAAPQGRSGKTVVSIGICALLRKAGFTVQPFKKGPDYIDASWLTAATGPGCRNLDAFLMPEETVKTNFERASAHADCAFIEGNMGLYDGMTDDGKGSSAHLARMLHVPVVLVVNTARMTRSVAAMVKGYQAFEADTPIAGIILNNVSGERHKQKLRRAIEDHCGIPVVGAVPRDSALQIPERHLGLVPFRENLTGAIAVERILRTVEKHLDLERLLAIGRGAREEVMMAHVEPQAGPPVARIGVILDRAFHFYYPENLEALESAGAELCFIDSMKDSLLPPIDGLYIGGGFPELYLKEIEANKGLGVQIREAIEAGLPVYAECAGLMFLCDRVWMDGQGHEMAQVIPAEVEFLSRPQGHGYVEAEVRYENPFYPVGTLLRGHEFHHSRITRERGIYCALGLLRGRGVDGRTDGIVYKNIFASYMHVHASGTPIWAESFVALSSRNRGREDSSFDTGQDKEVTHG
jgi:cobyrinic acid a,c-diamide synthase